MICPPCAAIADDLARYRDAHFELRGGTTAHRPDICRDAAIQPHGCACRHGHDGPNARQTTTRTREAQHA